MARLPWVCELVAWLLKCPGPSCQTEHMRHAAVNLRMITTGPHLIRRMPAYSRARSLCGMPMINPKNHYYKIWAFMLIAIDATYTAFLVPIGVGFRVSDTKWDWIAVIDFLAGAALFTHPTGRTACHVPAAPAHEQRMAVDAAASSTSAGLLVAMAVTDLGCFIRAGTVFVLDLTINFHVGYVVTNNFQRRLVMDAHQVAVYYIKMGVLVKHVPIARWPEAGSEVSKTQSLSRGSSCAFAVLQAAGWGSCLCIKGRALASRIDLRAVHAVLMHLSWPQ